MEDVALSVVIVNWNTKDNLRSCLHSVLSETHHSLEIIVVDNHSSDDSVAMVRSEFPAVRVLENRSNAGFPIANNQAFVLARGRFVLMLNPDTVVLNRALDQMVSYLEENSHVGAVGCKLLNSDGSVQYMCARSFPTPATVFFDLLGLSKAFPRSRIFGRTWLSFWDHDSSGAVPALSGACLLVRRPLLMDVGMLATDIFMYMEDYELCYRLWRAGTEVHYLHTAQVTHHVARSSRQVRDRLRPFALTQEGYLLFMDRHYGAWTVIQLRAAMAIGATIRLATVAAPFAALFRRVYRSEPLEAVRTRYLWLLRRSLELAPHYR